MGERQVHPGQVASPSQGNTQTTKQTLIHTPKGNLERPISLTVMFKFFLQYFPSNYSLFIRAASFQLSLVLLTFKHPSFFPTSSSSPPTYRYPSLKIHIFSCLSSIRTIHIPVSALFCRFQYESKFIQ
ncbi:hypothetical protein ILYODFUR_037289 [Ilyodon furcidens]|uniref:Uncharacterized protein n=1 Tax=Ilyodon furcidens TaxID=33524 RepID=A0ABV0STG0_9TELE